MLGRTDGCDTVAAAPYDSFALHDVGYQFRYHPSFTRWALLYVVVIFYRHGTGGAQSFQPRRCFEDRWDSEDRFGTQSFSGSQER